jgi:hypothetical protein
VGAIFDDAEIKCMTETSRHGRRAYVRKGAAAHITQSGTSTQVSPRLSVLPAFDAQLRPYAWQTGAAEVMMQIRVSDLHVDSGEQTLSPIRKRVSMEMWHCV